MAVMTASASDRLLLTRRVKTGSHDCQFKAKKNQARHSQAWFLIAQEERLDNDSLLSIGEKIAIITGAIATQ